MRDIVIIGAKGTALDVLSIIYDVNAERERYRCIGLLDDNHELWNREVLGFKVLGPVEEARRLGPVGIVNTLGSPRNYMVRRTVGLQFAGCPGGPESIIHPSAVISRYATLSPGAIIFPNVVVMAHVRIGQQVLILANSVINHEAIVGDFSILASGVNLSGNVRVGSNCYLGSGSLIRQNLTVGEGALIGMGSVVTRDVPAGAVLAGNPARSRDRLPEQLSPFDAD